MATQDMNDVFGRRRQLLAIHHPPTKAWTIDDLRQALGVFSLNGPVPPHRFLQDDELESGVNARACD